MGSVLGISKLKTPSVLWYSVKPSSTNICLNDKRSRNVRCLYVIFFTCKFTCKMVVPVVHILKPKVILSTFENTYSDGNFCTHEKDGATSGSGASF